MSSATLSLGDVLRRASDHLDKTSETGRLDAELLLAHTLGAAGFAASPGSMGAMYHAQEIRPG